MDTLLHDKLAYLRQLLDEVADLATYTLTALHDSLLTHAPPHLARTITQLATTRQRATTLLARAYAHYGKASAALGLPVGGALATGVATALCTRALVHMLLARLTLWRTVRLLLAATLLSLSSTAAAAVVPAAAVGGVGGGVGASVVGELLRQSPSIAVAVGSIAQAYWVVGQQVVSLLLALGGVDGGGGGGSGGEVLGRVVDVVDKLRKETSGDPGGAVTEAAVTRTAGNG